MQIPNFYFLQVHPGRLTWNLQITHLDRKIIFPTSMVMVHVNLPGCKWHSSRLRNPWNLCTFFFSRISAALFAMVAHLFFVQSQNDTCDSTQQSLSEVKNMLRWFSRLMRTVWKRTYQRKAFKFGLQLGWYPLAILPPLPNKSSLLHWSPCTPSWSTHVPQIPRFSRNDNSGQSAIN